MAMCKVNAPMQNVQAVIPFSYPINLPAARNFMREERTKNHYTASPPLLPDEIVEQCLALVYAMLEMQHHGVQESLTLILQERLQLLQDRLP